MSELTIEDFLSDLVDAKNRLDDALDDVTEAERSIEAFCDENDIEYPDEIL